MVLMLLKSPLLVGVSVLALSLSACGGGGGGDSSGGTSPAPTEPESFLVTTQAGDGGSIAPESSLVESGSTTEFVVTPTTNYRIDSASGCGGNLAGNVFITGPITGECTIVATFSLDLSTVTLEAVSMPAIGTPVLFEATNAPPGVIFASTEETTFGDGAAGVWRSTDGGENWFRSHVESVSFIAIASGDPNWVIAGGEDFYLVSDDLGQTWSRGSIPDLFGAPIGFSSGALHSPDDAFFMTTDSAINPGVYRSLDLGSTWQRVNNEVRDVFGLTDIQVSSANPNTLYVLSFLSEGIWKSVNSGDSFFSIKAGISTGGTFAFAGGIRVNPVDSEQIFIPGHVSVNGGANWADIADVDPANMTWSAGSIARFRDRGDFSDSGDVALSKDAGVSWEIIATIFEPSALPRFTNVWVADDFIFLETDSASSRIYRLPRSVLESAQ